jgi:hypothetical protein
MTTTAQRPAWDISQQTDTAIAGDPLIFRDQRLMVYSTGHWQVRDVHLQRSGYITITLGHPDTNESAEIEIRHTDWEGAARELHNAIVWFVQRAGDSRRNIDERQAAECFLDRLEGAIAGARAALDSSRATAAEVA